MEKGKVNESIARIAEEQRKSFVNRDLQLFMKNYDLDVISDYYTRKLFENYSGKPVKECRAEIKNIEIKDNIKCEIAYEIIYFEYDSEELLCLNELKFSEDSGSLLIYETKIKNTRDILHIDNSFEQSINISQMLSDMKKEALKLPLSHFHQLMEYAGNTQEPLTPSIYSRAVSKSIRYRMAHPEIECGIILTNMMSDRAIYIARYIQDNCTKDSVRKLNFIFEKLFVHKTYREVRHMDKTSFPVRELSIEPVCSNIDELLFTYEKGGFKRVEVKCSEIAPFYSSVLRILGFDWRKSIMLLLPFHYMNFFEIDSEYFIADVNHITRMNRNRVYGGYDEIAGIITPEYYIDQSGYTNMPSELYQKIVGDIHEKLPCFKFAKNLNVRNQLPEEVGLKVPPFNGYNLNMVRETIKDHVFRMSRDYPKSPYTWAKYCYQTLFVNNPQAYAIYSLSSKQCIEFAAQIKSVEGLFDWIGKNIEDESIYLSPDQIMMSDQVLTHRCGRVYDRALFVYTVLKLNGNIKVGGLVICDDTAYVAFSDEQDRKILYDINECKAAERIREAVIMGFNEEVCYSMWKNGENNLPGWISCFC